MNTVQEENVKGFNFILAVFCVLLWTLCGCSTDVDGMMSFVPDSGLSEDDEPEEYIPDSNPDENGGTEQPVTDPGNDTESEGHVSDPGEENVSDHKDETDRDDKEDQKADDKGDNKGDNKENNKGDNKGDNDNKVDKDVPQDSGGDEDETEEFVPEPEQAVFLACSVISETEIDFEFSSPVSLLSLSFDPGMEISTVEEGSTVKVYLEDALKPGQRLMAGFSAKDEWGNVIDKVVPLLFKNSRVPKLLINELRTEYSSPNAEFIEFKMISAGNLGGLRVFAAWLNKNPMIYEFPPVEVAAEEYVVLHLRTLQDLCRDELGENLEESGGKDSCSTARDLWVPGTNKLLHKTDAVYVMDHDDRVLDAIMLSEASGSSWDKSYFTEAAEFLFIQDAWESPTGICSPGDAVSSVKINTAFTRSISRDETMDDTNTAAEWYVTANGGVTPGLPNNPKRFE